MDTQSQVQIHANPLAYWSHAWMQVAPEDMRRCFVCGALARTIEAGRPCINYRPRH